MTLSDENGVSDAELQQLASRALKFQRFIFRRAWGVYYAVWAAAIAAFSFSFPFLNLIGVSGNGLPWFFYAAFYGGIGVAAGAASVWIFKNAVNTANLRKALKPDSQARLRYRLFGIWWIAFYVLILIAFIFFNSNALTILYAMLFSVAGFIYYQLRFSFQNNIPFEGKLAVISYIVSAATSLVATLVTSSLLPEAIVWGSIVAIWLIGALYSLRHASEELAALSY